MIDELATLKYLVQNNGEGEGQCQLLARFWGNRSIMTGNNSQDIKGLCSSMHYNKDELY